MNKEQIKLLTDNELIIELMKIYESKNITMLCKAIDMPYNTMSKWQCINGIPTSIPSKGYTRQYLEALLSIETKEKLNNDELCKYREYFRLQDELLEFNKTKG